MPKTPLTDGFNPKLIEGAFLQGPYDIPTIQPIPDTVPLPESLIPFDKRRQTKEMHQWIHCYLFDQRFRQLLNNPEKYVEEISLGIQHQAKGQVDCRFEHESKQNSDLLSQELMRDGRKTSDCKILGTHLVK